MKRSLWLPLTGLLIAIAITSTMDASGLLAFSALPLLPLTALFWYISRFSRQQMGFSAGKWRDYGLAALYPVLVLTAIAGIAIAIGAADFSQANWAKACCNLVLVALSTFLVAILTEEGFFRGWLWASLT